MKISHRNPRSRHGHDGQYGIRTRCQTIAVTYDHRVGSGVDSGSVLDCQHAGGGTGYIAAIGEVAAVLLPEEVYWLRANSSHTQCHCLPWQHRLAGGWKADARPPG